MRTVFITGASSGLGEALARCYQDGNTKLYIVGRNETKLKQLEIELAPCTSIVGDLSDEKFLLELSKFIQEHPIDLLINNAGIGLYGSFKDISIEDELLLHKLNIIAPMTLMKAYIQSKQHGKILNICSIAARQVDPLMATYGASKSYLYMLSRSVEIELRHLNQDIHIFTCVPGSFQSNFDQRAHVTHPIKSVNAMKIAQYTKQCVEQNKKLIVPMFKNKIVFYLGKLTPETIMSKIEWNIQNKKGKA